MTSSREELENGCGMVLRRWGAVQRLGWAATAALSMIDQTVAILPSGNS